MDVSGKLFGPILKGPTVLVVKYRRCGKTFGSISKGLGVLLLSY